MGTKTISITDEAYDVLKSWKEDRDSFSSVILKLGKKQDLLRFAGFFSEKRAKELKESISDSRKRSRDRYK
jgi:predicted CopG family antitoxin